LSYAAIPPKGLQI